MNKHFDLSLYLVLVPELCKYFDSIEVAKQAITGSATMVQLRMKNSPTRDIVDMAMRLKPVLQGIPLIINDNIDAAKAVDAHGVHLGQEDQAVDLARSILGPDKIIGVSVNTQAHLDAITQDVDYIGVGPVYATKTKQDTKPILGLNGLQSLASKTKVPCVAIGGIDVINAKSVRAIQGVDGIAVVSSVCSSDDPVLATRSLLP